MGINKTYNLNKLTDEFYNIYNEIDFPEILRKRDRPYVVFIVTIDNMRFALPLRTNIRHKNAYLFKNTNRDSDAKTGIDFSKAVVITEKDFIGESATIDNREYIELNQKIFFIIKKFRGYLEGFKRYISGNVNQHNTFKYQYSTLNYFKKELGL